MAKQPPELIRDAVLTALDASAALDDVQVFRERPTGYVVPHLRLLRGAFETPVISTVATGTQPPTVLHSWLVELPVAIVQNDASDTLESAIIELFQTKLTVSGLTVRDQRILDGSGGEYVVTEADLEEDETFSETLDINVLTLLIEADAY